MIELSTIRDLVAIFGVIAGFSYYVLTVRANQKNQALTLKSQEHSLETRKTALMMQLFQEIGSPEYWERYTRYRYGKTPETIEEFMQEYGPETNPTTYAEISSYWYTYVIVGSLLYDNKLDLRIIALNLGDLPVRAWDKWGHIIEHLRESYGWEGAWIAWEYLVSQLREYIDTEFNPIIVKDMRQRIKSESITNTDLTT